MIRCRCGVPLPLVTPVKSRISRGWSAAAAHLEPLEEVRRRRCWSARAGPGARRRAATPPRCAGRDRGRSRAWTTRRLLGLLRAPARTPSSRRVRRRPAGAGGSASRWPAGSVARTRRRRARGARRPPDTRRAERGRLAPSWLPPPPHTGPPGAGQVVFVVEEQGCGICSRYGRRGRQHEGSGLLRVGWTFGESGYIGGAEDARHRGCRWSVSRLLHGAAGHTGIPSAGRRRRRSAAAPSPSGSWRTRPGSWSGTGSGRRTAPAAGWPSPGRTG